MAAPKNNSFWKLRSTHGRDRIFSSPEILWEEACKYFEWCDDNPLTEERLSNAGKIDINLMRAYTLAGLFFFLKMSQPTWQEYKKREEFKSVIEQIEQVVYTQKFTGAAAGLLNANIISRDLGLVDKQEREIKDQPERDFSGFTDEELKLYAELEKKLTGGK